MADDQPTFTKPMAWWGTIQAAASERLTTAEVWDRIKAEAEVEGFTLPPNMFQAVNEIRSQAVQLRNATETLTRAAPESPILGEHLAPLPYGEGIGGAAGPRTFDVRVEYDAVRSGQPESSYVTLRYTGGLPATVGQLREEAAIVTQDLVESYGAGLVSVGAIQIGEL